ncbi:MAG TPA: hypothetical protein VMB50_16245 [Myxococcales bacterium]|nr:hypothetical protein [Myxococcales bacterium]
MPTGERHCQTCGAAVSLDGPIGRRDACDRCGADLHACVQCRFYDLSASNQCREPQAERVGDKVRSNFCELFQLAGGPGGAAADPSADARAKLDALFKR